MLSCTILTWAQVRSLGKYTKLAIAGKASRSDGSVRGGGGHRGRPENHQVLKVNQPVLFRSKKSRFLPRTRISPNSIAAGTWYWYLFEPDQRIYKIKSEEERNRLKG